VTIESDLTRGARAQQLLTDPLLTEAFTLVAQAIHEKWENAPLSDKEGAHELKLMLKLLSDVRANLEMAVHDGRMAQEKLKHLSRNPTPAEFNAAYR
jgi:hypothetical protein